jgi:tetratricopeptide (TPR) repeat protein
MFNPSKRRILANALLNLNNRYRQADKPQLALAATEEAVSILREIAKSSSDARNLLASSLGHNLYNSYLELGLHRQALQAAEESAQLYRTLQAEDSVFDAMLPFAIVNVGLEYARLGQWYQSLLAFEEAVSQSRQQQDVIIGGHAWHSLALSFLALPYNALGRRQEAMALTRQAVEVLASQAPKNSEQKIIYTSLLQQLASSYADLGLFNAALPPILEAVRINNTLDKTDMESLHRAERLIALARLYSKLGRDQESLATAKEAALIFQNRSGHPDMRKTSEASALILKSLAHHNLGESKLALSSTKEAIQLLREANTDEVYTQFELANALTNLGRFLADDGQSQQAQAPAQEAVVISSQPGPTSSRLARSACREQLLPGHHCPATGAILARHRFDGGGDQQRSPLSAATTSPDA